MATKVTLNDVLTANRASADATARLPSATAQPFDNFVGYIAQARQRLATSQSVTPRRLGNMSRKTAIAILIADPESKLLAVDVPFAIVDGKIVCQAHQLVLRAMPQSVRTVIS